MDTIDFGSLYDELQEYADNLWDISQSLDSSAVDAAKALAMYDSLENVYLEPARRKMYQLDTDELAAAYTQLDATTTDLNNTVNSIAAVIAGAKQVDQYAKLFDGVIAVAAKMLLLLG